MTSIDLLGLAAGSLTTLAFLPQVSRAWKTKSTGDLSFAWLVSFTAGVVLWLLYGLVLGSVPVIAANVVTLALLLVLLVLKLRFS